MSNSAYNTHALPPMSTEDLKIEILRCGNNPPHFMRKYCKIQHPVKGLINFDLYDFQEECIRQFRKHRFNIVLKSRQLGLSTVSAAYVTWFALFRKDKNVLVIATKLNTAINFIKKVRTILDNLPPWLLISKFEPTKQTIRFSNGSTITAVPTSLDAGRGDAISLLVVDEAAFIRDFDDIYTALYPTISTGGNAIILSTPNGVGGQYYKLWVEAEAGANDYNPIRLPWNVHPEHDQAWYDKETKNLPKRKRAQEFLCDFISSGDTFLQPTELDRLKAQITQPVEKEGPQMCVWIWKKPELGRRYVLSADVARGDASDFSAFHVIDYESCEVCAEYLGKIPPDKLSGLLMEYGKRYNNALICPEQNTFGYFTCAKLRDEGYPRLYYKDNSGDPFEYKSVDPDALPGFSTQSNTRTQILAKLEELLRNDKLKTSSQRLYDQMQAFVWNGSKAQASKDAHDDLIMSLAIGTWLIAGSGNVSGQSLDMMYAMLNATRVVKRDINDVTNHNQVRPVMSSQMYGSNPMRPKQQQLSIGVPPDFSWLYK